MPVSMATAHVEPARIEPAGIEDDWQDLDSNLSVHSLPTSDDDGSDDDDARLVNPGATPSSKSPTTARQATTSRGPNPNIPETSSTAAVTSDEAGKDAIASSTVELPLRPATFRLASTSPATTSGYPLSLSLDSDALGSSHEAQTQDVDDEADARSESSVGTVRDPSENPSKHHASLQTLALLVDEVRGDLQQMTSAFPSFDAPVVCTIQDALQVLSSHFNDLEPILAVYSQHWTKHGRALAAEQIPLHPGLLQWMDSLESCMFGLQDDVAEQVALASQDKITALVLGAAFAKPRIELEELSESLTEFLPIMKHDFSEFRSKYLVLPDVEVEQKTEASRRRGPRPEMVQIRRELYSLKDQLQAASALIGPLFAEDPAYFQRQTGDAVVRAMESLDTLRVIITTSLTNTGSDWIKSSAAPSSQRSPISFPALASLSPDVLRDVTGHLIQFRDELEFDDDNEDDDDPKVDKETIRAHQVFQLAEGGVLEPLLATLDFLQSLLMREESI